MTQKGGFYGYPQPTKNVGIGECGVALGKRGLKFSL